jgi:hypothetical protein
MRPKKYVPAIRSRFAQNPWTDERRAKQAEAIRRWQPWEKSIGPRTLEGRAKTGRNGKYSRAIAAMLRLPTGQFLKVLKRCF